jgi:hypothetical protein
MNTRGDDCTRRQVGTHPHGLSLDGRIDCFHDLNRAVGLGVTIGVELRSHIGIQPPAGNEAQCELSGEQYE